MDGLYCNPGDKYGRLTITKEVASRRAPSGGVLRRVACLCDCGNTVVVNVGSLRSRNTVSCGCSNMERITTHGLSGTPTWQSWRGMCKRCLDPRNQDFHSYGGRGITICQRWLGSFESFLEDMGIRPDDHSLDRIDNDGNYEPGNCRWATRSNQQRNKRSNHHLTYSGETLCIAEWADRLNVPHWLIRSRLRYGWTTEDALTIPPNTRRR